MKKPILFLLFILIVFGGFGQTKRAMVIAIGKYAALDGKGWRPISSVNDTALILPALRKQGFEKGNTTLLINEQATIENIRSAFDKLIENTKPNDVVVIHISAHGCQIEDDNGDEIDGLDESIVSYNAVQPTKSTDFKKDETQYLRDDELGEMIDEIRQEAGKNGEVLVMMDNCHSGSGTRAIENVYRGGEPAFRSKSPAKPYAKESSVSGDNFSQASNLAPYVVVSASRADELNKEIRIGNTGYGSLSYAVSKAMDNLHQHSTYQGFYTNVLATMNEVVPKQHPVIEGNALNKTFWRGEFKTKPVFYSITHVKDERMIVIDGGVISGISKGSVIHLYPIDTYDTTEAKVIAIGTVTSSENFKATVDLDQPLPELNTAYWAFLKKVYFPVKPVGISFTPVPENGESGLSSERQRAYTDLFAEMSQYDERAAPSLRIVQKNKKDVLVDVKTDYVFDTLGTDMPNIKELTGCLDTFLRYQFLKSYTLDDSNYRISVRLLPYLNNNVDTSLLHSKLENGVLTLKKDDQIVVEVTNHSRNQIYFNIVDMEPTGRINAVMPRKHPDKKKNILASDLTVPPGKTIIFDSFPIKISPPYGEEVFKIFVSNKILDLEYITGNTRDVKTDITSDLERVFKNSYRSGSRGDLGSKDGSVINVPFIIAPLKN
jgi:hypothetical protein